MAKEKPLGSGSLNTIFAFETTLSGRIYKQLIPRWQAQGYVVKLFFLQLPSPEMAIARVHQGVAAGGHNVPEDVIRRRFHAGLRNFNQIYRRNRPRPRRCVQA